MQRDPLQLRRSMVEHYCHIYGARTTINFASKFASDNDHSSRLLLASLQTTMCKTGTGCVYRCGDYQVSTVNTLSCLFSDIKWYDYDNDTGMLIWGFERCYHISYPDRPALFECSDQIIFDFIAATNSRDELLRNLFWRAIGTQRLVDLRSSSLTNGHWLCCTLLVSHREVADSRNNDLCLLIGIELIFLFFLLLVKLSIICFLQLSAFFSTEFDC